MAPALRAVVRPRAKCAQAARMRRWLFAWLCLTALVGCWRDPELPVLASVPPFRLVDQDAASLDDKSLRGRVWIANFIFTSCPDVCPVLTTKLATVRTQLARERARLRFVSFSVDPEHDTPAVLHKYASERGANQPDWRFATGPAPELQRVIVAGFKQTLQPVEATPGKERTILHGSHFVLVDGAMQLRGFYPTDPEGIARLVRDTRILVTASERAAHAAR